MSKKLLKSVFVVSAMTLLSRISGFLRDIVIAKFFGAGASFDAFSVAFKVPNLMRSLFAEALFYQAFVPILSEYEKQRNPEVNQFLGAVAGCLGSILICVTITGVVFAPWIVRICAPGFEITDPRFDLTVTVLRITFPYLLFVSFTTFAGAILNTHNHFAVASFTPVLLNIGMIIASFWLSAYFPIPIIGLAWGICITGVIQLLFQWPFLKKLNLFALPTINFHHTGVQKVIQLMAPAIYSVLLKQLSMLTDILFASLLVVGSVSWLYFSERLMEFPIGLFGVAIATVILPRLSHNHASQSQHNFSLTVNWALRCSLLVGLPASIILVMIATPLISTLFQHGQFDAHAVTMAQQSLAMFGIGVTPSILVRILSSGFYAKQNLHTPMRISIVAAISHIVFTCLLIWPLKHAGIALASSLSALVNCILLYYASQKRKIYLPLKGWKRFLSRVFISNSILTIWLWIGAGDPQEWISAHARWRVIHLSELLTSAVIIYLIVLWMTGLRPKHLIVSQLENA